MDTDNTRGFYEPKIVQEALECNAHLGESPLVGTVPAVLSAIHDAIGKPIRDLPATAERIWQTLSNDEWRMTVLSKKRQSAIW